MEIDEPEMPDFEGMGTPLPWFDPAKETPAGEDDQLTEECMAFLRDVSEGPINVLGSYFSRHEKFGLVFRVDYAVPAYETRDHDRSGPIPSRLVSWRDPASGRPASLSIFSSDCRGPLPGFDYSLKTDWEEPSPDRSPAGETAAEPDQAMMEASGPVLSDFGMRDDVRIVASLFSHNEQFGVVYRVDHVFGEPPTTDRPFRRIFWREPDGRLRSRIDMVFDYCPLDLMRAKPSPPLTPPTPSRPANDP
jgi:hypothetical protein